jgi:hypothetical protein
METHAWSYLEFVYTTLFERTRKGLFEDRELRELEGDLLKNPEAGDTLGNAGGVRKTRAAAAGRGKRGSGRVAYLYIKERQTIYFLLAFPKNVQANLTGAQRKLMREFAAAIKAERWPKEQRRK